MRPVFLAALIVVLACRDGAPQALPTQPEPSGLLVGNRVEEYFGESYTAPPRQNFVFFQGEPIAFRLIVGNMGTRDTALLVDGRTPQQLFRVESFVAATPPPGVTVERRVVGNKFDDEQTTNVRIDFSPPVKRWSGGVFAIQLERETVLDAKESIEWVMNLPSASLSPGLYRFTVKLNGRERGPQPLQGFGNFRFELRERSADDQPELLRREAYRRLSKEDYEGARRIVADLLRIHPNSYAAHNALAMIAEREGKVDEAANHRRNADDVYKGRRDELLLKYHPLAATGAH